VEQFQRILEALARVEITDGLTLPQLITESTSRIPHDATVVAVLAEVPPETALALGNLRRRGHAVTAVLVMFEDNAYEDAFGRLLAERIDVRHVRDDAGLVALCQQQVLR
jgi:hypothetical protein